MIRIKEVLKENEKKLRLGLTELKKQLVELYHTAKSTVSEHVKNIYSDEELSPDATVRKIRTVQKEGNREVSRELEYYNLGYDYCSRLSN